MTAYHQKYLTIDLRGQDKVHAFFTRDKDGEGRWENWGEDSKKLTSPASRKEKKGKTKRKVNRR